MAHIRQEETWASPSPSPLPPFVQLRGGFLVSFWTSLTGWFSLYLVGLLHRCWYSDTAVGLGGSTA